MSHFKYPVKYFCGQRLLMHSEQYIQQSLRIVSNDFPIVGETGIDGLLIDFNCGLRLQIPEGNWHVRIVDAESGLLFLDRDASGITFVSLEKFYVEWEIALWLNGELVFYHQFDPRGQKIHFNLSKALGDILALLPYVEQFRRTFDCEVTCSSAFPCRDIIQTYYPHIQLTDTPINGDDPLPPPPEDSYACYYLSAIRARPTATTADMRIVPLELVGQTILCSSKLRRPSKKIFTPTAPRSIEQKYVCIGVQASANPKCWLNPGGWDQVIDYLKSLGYRVLCIDKDRSSTNWNMTVEMPKGAEDFSGDYTLIDRVNQLAYADFFIGISSALAWLAWSVDIPVVLISGLTAPWYEFDTPYRVYNPLVCHGCFNHRPHDVHQILECLEHKDAAERVGERLYECSKKISARSVIGAIEQLIADHNLLEGRRGN